MGDLPKKVEPKMVRESDLLAVKATEKRLKSELAESKNQIVQLSADLKIAKTDGSDDEAVTRVKEALLAQNDESAKMREQLDRDLASFNERERESRVQAFASQYGVELDSIKDAENPELAALKLANERLTSGENPAEAVVESSGGGGLTTKMPINMNDEELEDFKKKKLAEHYAKA